jgi:hypothetical protein
MRSGEFMLQSPFRNLVVTVLTVVASGCFLRPKSMTMPVDPEATFAAHAEHGGIALDRTRRGTSGKVVPAGWVRTPGSPTFVLRVADQPVAFFWLSGDRVVARPSQSSAEPPTVEVVPAFEAGAIKLTIRPRGGGALHTDTLAREGGGTGPSLLSRNAQTVLDVRGTYRTTIRDGKGTPLGWFRVRISPYQGAARLYDARLPPDVDDTLPVAVMLALHDEIDWIERHATDVYRGNTGDHLERSIQLDK